MVQLLDERAACAALHLICQEPSACMAQQAACWDAAHDGPKMSSLQPE